MSSHNCVVERVACFLSQISSCRFSKFLSQYVVYFSVLLLNVYGNCLVSRRQTGRDAWAQWLTFWLWCCFVPSFIHMFKRLFAWTAKHRYRSLYPEGLCKRVCHCICHLWLFALTFSLFPSATSIRRLSLRIRFRKPRRKSARIRLQPVSQ